MKVTSSEVPALFKEISEFIIEDTMDDHRRGSNFYKQSIVEFTESDKEYFSDVPEFERYVGTWETNTYIYDSEYGTDWSEVHILTKVEKREKIVTTHEWVEVE